MSGKEPELTGLEARRQLLLLESGLNRGKLIDAVHTFKHELHCTRQQLTDLGTMATLATRAASTVSSATRLFSGRGDGGKKSWFSYLLNGTATGTSLWFLLRSFRRK
jgi:hypothetical protein